jgi:hypothetical protein
MKLKNRLALTLCATLLLTGASLEAKPSTEATLTNLKSIATQNKLQSSDYYSKRAKLATPIFLAQGGLVKLQPQLPTVLLPDLHAQRDYLVEILELSIDHQTVFNRLKNNTIQLLCMGDAMHSEQRSLDRWLLAEKQVSRGLPSPAMEDELTESLGLMAMIVDLKLAFPRNFYFVRGNHEDMDPESPYRKFTNVGESNLVKAFVIQRWGKDFLRQWHTFEQSLPLVAVGGSFVASHSPPELRITTDEVRCRTPRAFRACTWSNNPKWVSGGMEESAFQENCKTFGVTPKRPWLCGHRKVDGALYRSQCDGRIIQINPNEPGNHQGQRVYILAPASGKEFVPKSHVKQLNRK